MHLATRTLLRAATLAAASAALGGVVGPTMSNIAFTGHGPAIDGSAGAPVPLGASAFLVAARGPGGTTTSSDDEILLVSGVGGSPVVTALATPFLSGFSGRLVRLSATSAAISAAGANGTFGNADDVVHLLTGIGTSNTVTSVVVGGLNSSDGYAPERLSATALVVASRGADNTANNADDEVVVITDIGGTNTETHLAAPFLPSQGRSRPVALSPSAFLVASNGPNGTGGDADDVTYLFTGVTGAAATRADLATPNLYASNGAPSRPIRVSGSRGLVSAMGTDASLGTADDVLLLLDDLGGTNTVTPIVVGGLFDYGAGQPTALRDDLAVVATRGANLGETDADDGIAVVSGLGTTNTVTQVVLGPLEEDAECHATALGSDSCALAVFGADNSSGTGDDEVVVLTGVGTTNTITRIPVGGLAGGITSRVEPLSADSFLVATGGTTTPSFSAGGDSRVTLVTGVPGSPVVQHAAVGGDSGDEYSLPATPFALGEGRAVHLWPGADNDLGAGTDDVMQVISNLPVTRALVVTNLSLKFDAEDPGKAAKLSLKADLATADDVAFYAQDVTISVGNAAQTIPAASLVLKKGKVQYADRKGVNGFVTKLVYDPAKGTIQVKGKGIGTGLETTDATYVPVAVERGDGLIGTSVVGTETSKGISYKPE